MTDAYLLREIVNQITQDFEEMFYFKLNEKLLFKVGQEKHYFFVSSDSTTKAAKEQIG